MKLAILATSAVDVISSKYVANEVFIPVKLNNQFRLRDMFSQRRILLSEAIPQANPTWRVILAANREKGWIRYLEGDKIQYMQIMEVNKLPAERLRVVVKGKDAQQSPVVKRYDVIIGKEFSDVFKEVKQLGFGDIVKLVRQGVVTDGGRPIKDLAGLKKIADKAGLKLIEEKEDEDVFHDRLPIEQVEAQLFRPIESISTKRYRGRQSRWTRK